MAELSKPGSGARAVTSSASTQPWASASGSGRAGSGATVRSTSCTCWSTFFISASFEPFRATSGCQAPGRRSRTPRGHVLLQPRPEVRPEVLALTRDLDDRLEVVPPVAGVVATPVEDDAVHRLPVGERLDGVGQLDLAPTSGRGVAQHLEDGRRQDVPADDRE